METSILNSTKKVLNVPETQTAFDVDIIMHINAAFAVLTDIGIGPTLGFAIEDAEAKWSDLGFSLQTLALVRSYVYQKTRLAFDPPSMSFHLDALKQQIAEFEWRLSVIRENLMEGA